MTQAIKDREWLAAGWIRHDRSSLLRGTALQATALMALTGFAGVPTAAIAQPAPNARPTGGVVVGGGASIAQSTALTAVTQTTGRAAIDWKGFDVGAQHAVRFIQPSAGAIVLNRVMSSNPSQIAGRIAANGQVVLQNQSGVIFYQGAQVNAAALVVTTSGIDPGHFMAGGKLVFDQPPKAGARIENHGTITIAEGGLAALVAPQVVNRGVIAARMGKVVLAGAEAHTVDLYGDGLLSIDVTRQVRSAPLGPDGKPVTALVTNSGTIQADGGILILTAQAVDGIVTNLVSAGGTVQANSVGARTGRILVQGRGGSVRVDGAMIATADAPGAKGGEIGINATRAVVVGATATLDASGRAGGGTIALGTTLARARGGQAVASRRTAEVAFVARGARIAATATGAGAGGKVVVLSTEATAMAGTIEAKGGPAGGDGGFVEVSGAKGFGLTGGVDVSAPFGRLGSILIDPTDLTIRTAAGTLDPTLTTSNKVVFADGGASESVSNTVIDALSGVILLQATHSITVLPATPLALKLDASLQLETNTGDITVGASSPITASGTGALSFKAGQTASSGGKIVLNSDLTTGVGSSITLQADGGIALNATTLTTGTLSVKNVTSNGLTQAAGGKIAATVLSGSGPVAGGVSLLGGSNQIATLNGLVTAGAGLTLVDGTALALAGTIDVGGGTIDLTTTGVGSGLTQSAGGKLVAGRLTSSGNIGGSATLTRSNAVTTLGPFTASGSVALTDTVATLGVSGKVAGTAVTLTNPGGIALAAGAAISAPGGTVQLDASAGAIDASLGAITANVLTSSVLAGGAATFTGSNTIATLGPFAAAGALSLSDSAALLTVAGTVAGSDVTLSNPGGIVLAAGGLLSAPGGTVTLKAFVGAVDASAGGVTALSLTGVSQKAANFTGTNAVTNFSFTSTNGAVSLVDAVPTLILPGTVSATDVTLINPGGITLSPGALILTPILAGTVQLDAAVGSIDASKGGITAKLLRSAVTTGGKATLTGTNTLATIGNFAATTGFSLADGQALDVVGAVKDNAIATITTTSGLLTVSGSVTAPAINLAGTGITITGKLDDTGGGAGAGVVSLAGGAGAITASAGRLIAGTLTGSANSATLTGTNLVGKLNAFTTAAGFSLTDGEALKVIGVVQVSAGNALLTTSPGFGVTLAAGGSVQTPGHSASFETDILTLGGGAISAATFELAPSTSGAAITIGTLGAYLSSLSGIAAPTVRIGAITPPGGRSPRAGSIDVLGTFDAFNRALELDAIGAIRDSTGTGSLLNVATLGGNAGLVTLTSTGNTITSLGPLAATGAVSVTDAVAILGVAGTVSGAGITLTNPGGILFAPGGRLATPGTAQLDASGGAIDASKGAITAALLTDTVTTGGAASFTGINAIATLGPFAATGAFTLTDAVATLNVAGTVSGSGITLTNPGGILFAPGGRLATPGTAQLDASGGAIDASKGAITAAVLTDTVTTGGAASFTGINAIATLGPFAATGAFTLTDAVATLNVAGTVSGSGITLTNPGGILFAPGGRLATPGTAQLDASGGAIDASKGAITAAVLTDTVTTGGAASFTGINAIATLGPFAATGAFTLTDAVATLNVAGTVTGSGITLTNPGGILFAPGGRLATPGTAQLDASGGAIDASKGTITAALLTDTVTTGGAASFTGINAIATLGPFAATGAIVLNDAVPVLGIAGLVTGPAVTVANSQSIHVSGTVLASAGNAALTTTVPGSAITIANTGSLRAPGSVVSLQVDSLTVAPGGAIAAATFELAPPTAGSAVTIGTAGTFLASLSGVTATTSRIGAVTPPGAAVPRAGSIAVLGNFDAFNQALELDAAGAITGAGGALLNVTTLTGNAGSVALTGFANTIATLGNFPLGGGAGPATFSLNDGRALDVAGAIQAASSASIGSTAGLTVSGSVVAPAVSLSGASISLAGSVSDGSGLGSVNLAAAGGGIREAGTLLAGTLSGSSIGAASLTGKNAVTTLGPFAGTGQLTFIDSVPVLKIAGRVAGSGITLINPGGIVLDPGAVLMSAGIVQLDTAAGAIEASHGSVVAGVLTQSVATGGGASFTGGANRIATLGNFTAAGLALNDTTALTVAGVVNGGASVAIQSAGQMTVGGTISATNVALDGNGLVIDGSVAGPGSVSLTSGGIIADNGRVTAGSLIANAAGAITEPGSLVADTLTGSAGSASFSGSNALTTLAAFTTAGSFTLNDGALTLDGPLTAGGTVAIDTGGATLIVAGRIGASAVTLNAGSLLVGGAIAAPGAITMVSASTIGLPGIVTGGTVATVASGAVSQTGLLDAATLTGRAASANFAGAAPTANNVAALAGFVTAGALTLRTGGAVDVTGDSAGSSLTVSSPGVISASGDTAGGNILLTGGGVTLSGANSAPRINLAAAGPVIFAGGSFVTGRSAVPAGQITSAQVPNATSAGIHVVAGSFAQTGTTRIAPPATLTIDLTAAGSALFSNLVAANTDLYLNLISGSASGQVNVAGLRVAYQTANPAGIALTGLVGGQPGQAAASVGTIAPRTNTNYRFNNCAIGSVNCFVIAQFAVPTASPLGDISVGPPATNREELELILPNVADRDY